MAMTLEKVPYVPAVDAWLSVGHTRAHKSETAELFGIQDMPVDTPQGWARGPPGPSQASLLVPAD